MSTHSKSEFKITLWQETPYDEQEQGAKLVRVAVQRVFQGHVEAQSSATLLMCQSPDGSAGYVASERVTGRIGERGGSFVIQHGGSISGGQPQEVFGYVVPGSGTDELQGLRGNCRWYHDEHEASFTFDYEMPDDR